MTTSRDLGAPGVWQHSTVEAAAIGQDQETGAQRSHRRRGVLRPGVDLRNLHFGVMFLDIFLWTAFHLNNTDKESVKDAIECRQS
jgi:hypothetical protein